MTEQPSNTSIALIALMKLKGVGRRAALRLVDCALPIGNAHEACNAVVDRMERAKLPVAEFLTAWSRAEEELERSFSLGVRAYALHDANYPKRLKDIPDPPAVLFVKGGEKGLVATYFHQFWYSTIHQPRRAVDSGLIASLELAKPRRPRFSDWRYMNSRSSP
jgi:hypothetical protein